MSSPIDMTAAISRVWRVLDHLADATEEMCQQGRTPLNGEVAEGFAHAMRWCGDELLQILDLIEAKRGEQ